jgi:spermidine synthase
VASLQTKFQRIDIYDAIFQKTGSIENYRKSLLNDGSYESRHKELFRPDRVLFLDGWLQSTLKFEAAYHEALVHPALFAHPNPKRVAIIGGGECATIREVLKHNTVEKISMIEIDEEMVTESRENIPEWSDCSDLEGSSSWCVDDPKTSMYYEDAHGWFMDRYTGERENSGDLDIIILDAL